MKKEYDFSKGKRGALIKTPPTKTRITIRIDKDILDWFREQVHKAGGGNYQTLINIALKEYVNSKKDSLEDTLRRIIREELPKDFKYSVSEARKAAKKAGMKRSDIAKATKKVRKEKRK